MLRARDGSHVFLLISCFAEKIPREARWHWVRNHYWVFLFFFNKGVDNCMFGVD